MLIWVSCGACPKILIGGLVYVCIRLHIILITIIMQEHTIQPLVRVPWSLMVRLYIHDFSRNLCKNSMLSLWRTIINFSTIFFAIWDINLVWKQVKTHEQHASLPSPYSCSYDGLSKYGVTREVGRPEPISIVFVLGPKSIKIPQKWRPVSWA